MAKNKFHNFYERMHQAYDILYGPILAYGMRRGLKMMKVKSGMKVLEVGIGTGLSLPHYPRQAEIHGIDISEAMLKQAQKKIDQLDLKKTKLHVMSAEKLNFKDNSFDRVFAPSVVSVVTNPKKTIEEMIRVCKPDGLICIVAHFEGDRPHTNLFDRLMDPVTQKFFGFRMLTSRNLVENNPRLTIVAKTTNYFLNFSNIYLLKKK